jgi:hypothetical protein
MLKEYFKYKLDVYILISILLIIYILILSLAHISFDLIMYLIIFSFIILILYFIITYIKFINLYKQLKQIENEIDILSTIHIDNHVINKQYSIIINKLNNEYNKMKLYENNKYNHMIEYYTMWVHQIKTPISALKLLIQDSHNQDMLLELIKIEQYVDMVLQYLRISHINNDFSFQYISLDHIVSEVLKKQVLFFSSSKISLNYHIQDIEILTDEKWISFVIEQILSNALKYTKKGIIEIYNDENKLFIKDSGMGIREEDLPRVYERGFTGYNGRVDKKASGIGLYLVRNIIDKMGYRIDIESKVNVGTTVCIDFNKKNIGIE